MREASFVKREAPYEKCAGRLLQTERFFVVL